MRESDRPEDDFELGLQLLFEEYGIPDEAEAFRRLLRAAEKGHQGAAVHVAMCYHWGFGVEADPLLRIRWLRRAVHMHPLPETTRSEFADMWGDLCGSEGLYPAPEPPSAADVAAYRKLADAGVHEAEQLLGLMHLYGSGVELDSVLAVSWFKRAAEAGLPIAEFCLALAYEIGDGGVQQDYGEALRLIHRSSYGPASGYCFKLRERLTQEALVSIGSSDPAEGQRGVAMLELVARYGHLEAQYQLGLIKLGGPLVAADAEASRGLLTDAATKGHAGAQHILGLMLSNGRLIDRLYGVEWLKRAALQGNIYSQYHLARILAEGLADPQSARRALYWLSLALRVGLSHGYADEATRLLTKLRCSLSVEELTEIEAAVGRWKPKSEAFERGLDDFKKRFSGQLSAL